MEVKIKMPPVTVKYMFEDDKRRAEVLAKLVEHELGKPKNLRKLQEFVESVSQDVIKKF